MDDRPLPRRIVCSGETLVSPGVASASNENRYTSPEEHNEGIV
jgi:hypothetical protein